MIPKDTDEQLAYARRLIAQRCLYGVDKNPLAVEMAKLSLWLLTSAKDKPFTFLDHAIRCGDSLVGIHNLEQLRTFNLDLHGEENQLLYSLENRIKEVVGLRTRISATQSDRVEDVQVQTSSRRRMRSSSGSSARRTCSWEPSFSDGTRAISFTTSSMSKRPMRTKTVGPRRVDESKAQRRSFVVPLARQPPSEWRAFSTTGTLANSRLVQTWLNGQSPFHWPLEFAEVIVDHGGFDAIVCNPPFMGGQKITGNLGEDYESTSCTCLPEGSAAAPICVPIFS